MIRIITGEYSLQKELVDLLLSKGYPEDSIFIDWNFKESNYNLAIIDPENKELLALFQYEINNRIILTTERIRKIIEGYHSLDLNPKIHFYIVNAMKGEESFSISKILLQTKNSNLPHTIEVKNLPDFDGLKTDVSIYSNSKTEDDFIIKLRLKIKEIENLKKVSSWGPEYKIWYDLTSKLISVNFGEEGLKLFQQQKTVLLSDEAYRNELDSLRKIIEGLITNREEYKPKKELISDAQKNKTKFFTLSYLKGFISKYKRKIVIIICLIVILLFLGFKLTSIQLGPFGFSRENDTSIKVIPRDVEIEAAKIAEAIMTTGYEDAGDYIGYLSQITSFYQRHQDLYPQEFATYSRQLKEWQDKLEKLKNINQPIYSSDISGLKGLIISARNQLYRIGNIKPPTFSS